MIAANGATSALRLTQPPSSTRWPLSRARAAIASTRRVLPTPASPATSATPGWPPTARPIAASSRANSAWRPISVGLESRVATAPMLRPADKPRPLATDAAGRVRVCYGRRTRRMTGISRDVLDRYTGYSGASSPNPAPQPGRGPRRPAARRGPARACHRPGRRSRPAARRGWRPMPGSIRGAALGGDDQPAVAPLAEVSRARRDGPAPSERRWSGARRNADRPPSRARRTLPVDRVARPPSRIGHDQTLARGMPGLAEHAMQEGRRTELCRRIALPPAAVEQPGPGPRSTRKCRSSRVRMSRTP